MDLEEDEVGMQVVGFLGDILHLADMMLMGQDGGCFFGGDKPFSHWHRGIPVADGGVCETCGILHGLDPLSSLVHVAHLRFQGDNDVAFDSLGCEAALTFDLSSVNGLGEGGYCRVVETSVVKIC